MLDTKLLREDLSNIAAQLLQRGYSLDINKFQTLENQRKQLQIRVQEMQAAHNLRIKLVGQQKASGEDIAPYLQELGHLTNEIKEQEKQLTIVQEALQQFLSQIPNLPQADVPRGQSAAENVLRRIVGVLPAASSSPAPAHDELGKRLGMMDFEVAVQLSGTRFTVLKGQLARLQRALIQFMLDTHTEKHGYQEVYVPFLVNTQTTYATGQLPNFAEDLFYLERDGLYLIPTAEVPVTNLVAESIIEETALPLKYVCHSPCFRREAGAAGRDTKGMLRQHQFEKVELVQLVPEAMALAAHEALTMHAEVILQELALPYRVMELCTGDLGFASSKTYDLEVWLPSQGQYREISSCSYFGNFQTRRMQARWRSQQDRKIHLLHSINGSALAVGRTLVAILENYQDLNGKIAIPKVLQKYMGQEFIAANT